MKEPHQLHYEVNLRRFPRRLVKWMLAVLVLASVYAAWTFGPRALRHGRYLAAQRAMLRHTLAHDMLVFDMERFATELLKNEKLYRPWPELQSGRHAYAPAAFYYPFKLDPYLPTPRGIDGVLFMHRIENPAGDDRLVIAWISVRNMNTALTTDISISAAAYEPAKLKPSTTLTLVPGSKAQLFHTTYWPPLRLWAGQPDPHDPTHFTIPYSLAVGSEGNEWRRTIDGWLRGPDQDHPTEHIVLDARDGPLDFIHGL